MSHEHNEHESNNEKIYFLKEEQKIIERLKEKAKLKETPEIEKEENKKAA